MSDLFLLSEAQMGRTERYFSLSRGVPRVDDRRCFERDYLCNQERSWLA